MYIICESSSKYQLLNPVLVLFVVGPESAHIRQLSSKYLLFYVGETPEDVAGDVDTGPAGVKVPQTVLQCRLLESHQCRGDDGC